MKKKIGLCKAKVGGIRPQSGVIKNNLTTFCTKSAVFGETIKYITGIHHVGIQVLYMAGKLLKKYWVISYFVGKGKFVLT